MIRRLFILAFINFIFNPAVYADINSANAARARGDYSVAAEEYLRLAEAGNPVAQASLGYMYYIGEGVTQDYQEAVNWYIKAAEQGLPDAQYNLAVAHTFGEGTAQDYSKAAEYYRRAADQDHAIAQYSLGLSYSYGEGVTQDAEEAASWFGRAAELGYVRAQVLLGSKYHTGDGVPLNYEEAARWYSLAAEQGDATAQYNLGGMYRSGKGIAQDYDEALKWYRMSAEQGYAAASAELAGLERAVAAANRAAMDTAPVEEPVPESGPATVEPETYEVMAPLTTAVDTAVETAAVTAASSDVATVYPMTEDSIVPAEALPAEDVVEEAAEETVLPGPEATADQGSELLSMENVDPALPEDTRNAVNQLLTPETATSEPPMQSVATVEPSGTESGPMEADMPAAENIPDTTTISNAEAAAPAAHVSVMEATAQTEVLQTAMAEQTTVAEMPVAETAVATMGIAAELYDKGIIELNNKNYGDAVTLFQAAAAQGYPTAQYQLGTLYYQGFGLEQNYEEAALWYRRAAEQDNNDAQFSLGNMFLMGEGVSQSDAQAKYWYERAAEQGHTSAQHNLDNLARIASAAETVPADSMQAVIEVESPADTTEMMEELPLTETPAAVEDDATVQVATAGPAEQMDVPASIAVVDYERGLAYSFGEGVAKDLQMAFDYFRKAAESNYAPAQYKLGVAYAYAEGTSMDLSQSAHWYERAALQGHSIAQRNLGVMYQNGQGRDQNRPLALAWFSILADNGNVMDIRRMEALSGELTSDEIEQSEQLKRELIEQINSSRQ